MNVSADVALVPSCFGFEVDSSVPLQFTRSGGGKEQLRVLEHRSQSAPCDAEPLFQVVANRRRKAALWGNGAEYEFLVDGFGCYRIDPVERHIAVPVEADPIRREQVMWGVPATLCFVERGDLCIHAAAVEVDGGAVLLAAPGQYGKTTLAVAFHRAGYRILSEDSSCCRFETSVLVAPGPGLVRMRDIGVGVPEGLELVTTREGRAELSIATERRATGASIPLRGIVFLRESTTPPTLKPCRRSDALRDLWALHFGLPDPAARARSFEQVADLASGTPCWDMSRRRDLSLLDEAVQRIIERLA